MNERDRLIKLFDIYNKLLTDKQVSYFKDYYFEDLSLSEIAENNNVSKAFTSKTLKTIENKLYSLEDILKILTKNEKIHEIVCNVKDENIKKQLEELI